MYNPSPSPPPDPKGSVQKGVVLLAIPPCIGYTITMVIVNRNHCYITQPQYAPGSRGGDTGILHRQQLHLQSSHMSLLLGGTPPWNNHKEHRGCCSFTKFRANPQLVAPLSGANSNVWVRCFCTMQSGCCPPPPGRANSSNGWP